MGVTKAANATGWVPSRDSFAFTGDLSTGGLIGKLSRSDQLRPELPAVTEDVVLPASREQREYMIQAETFGDWRKQVESILRFRGPKW
jgi:hypothetical protein